MEYESQKTEKFNAALDNIKTILNLKKMVQSDILEEKYIKAGDALTIWNFDIIGWKAKVAEEDVRQGLKKHYNNFNLLKNKNQSSHKEVIKKVIFDWYEDVLKLSYEIWLSKLEDDGFGTIMAE